MVENQLSSTSPQAWMKRKFKSLRKQMDGTTPQRAWFNFPSVDALCCYVIATYCRSWSPLFTYFSIEKSGFKISEIHVWEIVTNKRKPNYNNVHIHMKISRDIILDFALGCFYFSEFPRLACSNFSSITT